MKNNVTLRCYAEGRQGHWEAICLDFDIAVQGKSFDEVYKHLNSMIKDYIETVETYSAEDRKRLLKRKAPLWLRLKFATMYILAFLFGNSSDKERHNYISQTACMA